MTTPQHLSDRYELGDILGFGGMSEVHLARDVRLHRDVAVKVLRADLARDPSFYLRFRREAQNAAALNHPSIVAVYDTGEADTPAGPLPYIVMEYVDGVTLRDVVHTDGPLPPRRAIEIIADACQALNFSHQNGIIHRDVKPANIMISTTNAVKVMDFGIARALADSGNSVTQTAAVIGTAQSTPDQTSIRWAVFFTKSSPVNHLSPETRLSRLPTSMFARTRYHRRSGTRASPPTSTPSF
jgi:eukaryotic-like serine/threonine-protein kinase